MQLKNTDLLSYLERFKAPWMRPCISLLWRFRHLVPFALVGVSGLLVNSTVLAIATRILGLGKMTLTVSAILATVCSTSWNFTLTELWVFRDRRRPGWPRRLVMFFLMNNAALLLRVPILNELTFGLHIHYLISNAISIGVVTLVRYVLSDAVIWRAARRREPAQPSDEEKTLG
jgi:putative flippase GtrA